MEYANGGYYNYDTGIYSSVIRENNTRYLEASDKELETFASYIFDAIAPNDLKYMLLCEYWVIVENELEAQEMIADGDYSIIDYDSGLYLLIMA